MNKQATVLKAIFLVFAVVSFTQDGIAQINPAIREIPFKTPSEMSHQATTAFNLCLSFSHTGSKEAQRGVVINTQNEYQSLMKYDNLFKFKTLGIDCKDLRLPEIDFSRKTLLGILAEGGGCQIEFEKKVLRDDGKKEYRYIVTVVETGLCQKMGESMNWIVIPKIAKDYKVIFETKKVVTGANSLK